MTTATTTTTTRRQIMSASPPPIEAATPDQRQVTLKDLFSFPKRGELLSNGSNDVTEKGFSPSNYRQFALREREGSSVCLPVLREKDGNGRAFSFAFGHAFLLGPTKFGFSPFGNYVFLSRSFAGFTSTDRSERIFEPFRRHAIRAAGEPVRHAEERRQRPQSRRTGEPCSCAVSLSALAGAGHS